MSDKEQKSAKAKETLINAKNKTKENNVGNLIASAALEAAKDILKVDKSNENSLD